MAKERSIPLKIDNGFVFSSDIRDWQVGWGTKNREQERKRTKSKREAKAKTKVLCETVE